MKFVVKWHDLLLHLPANSQHFPAALLLVVLRSSFRGADCHVELSDLVRVLAGRRNFDRARPVEVEVAEREGQVLQLHLREARVVLWHVEMGRQDTALGC